MPDLNLILGTVFAIYFAPQQEEEGAVLLEFLKGLLFYALPVYVLPDHLPGTTFIFIVINILLNGKAQKEFLSKIQRDLNFRN